MSRRACTADDFHSQEGWIRGEPTTTVQVEREDFSAELPYNPAWGLPDCHLTPYDMTDDAVIFGSAGPFEGGPARFGRIGFVPARSADDITRERNKELDKNRKKFNGDPLGTEPVTSIINGNTVVEYSYAEFCDQTQFEVIGKLSNYVVLSPCNMELLLIKNVLQSFTIH